MKSHFNQASLALVLVLLGTRHAACDEPLLIAHRGGVVDQERIENSLPALNEAIKRGYWMVEVDVRESKDGQLVVHHDQTFSRHYGDTRKVSEMTWDEIKQLKSQPHRQRPLHFREFARACRGKLRLMLDIKDDHGQKFFAETEQILRENDLLENAFVLGTEQSQQYFRGKAKVAIDLARLRSALENVEEVATLYYLFELAAKLDATTIQIAHNSGVTVVAAINTFRYPQARHEIMAVSDIERLRSLGVTHFQIDSVYEAAFKRER